MLTPISPDPELEFSGTPTAVFHSVVVVLGKVLTILLCETCVSIFFFVEVQVENTANLRSGRNNFVVRTQEVVQPRPEISPDLTADVRPPISFLACEERV